MSDAAATPVAPSTATPSVSPGAPSPAPKGEQPRAPDGKFTKPQEPLQAKPQADDDPEIDLGDLKLRRSALKSELARARQSTKLLTEAQKRQAEAMAEKKRLDEAKAKAKEDLGHIFSELSLTPEQERELIARYLHQKHVEPQYLTEEQRRIKELESKLNTYETEKKTAAEKEAEAARSKAEEEEANSLRDELLEAAKSGKIPGAGEGASPRAKAAAIRRVAAKMEAFEQDDISVTVEQAISAVKEDIERDSADFLASMSIEEQRERYGEEAFRAVEKRWREYFLAKLKSQPQSAPVPKPQVSGQHERKRLSPSEFRNKLMR